MGQRGITGGPPARRDGRNCPHRIEVVHSWHTAGLDPVPIGTYVEHGRPRLAVATRGQLFRLADLWGAASWRLGDGIATIGCCVCRLLRRRYDCPAGSIALPMPAAPASTSTPGADRDPYSSREMQGSIRCPWLGDETPGRGQLSFDSPAGKPSPADAHNRVVDADQRPRRRGSRCCGCDAVAEGATHRPTRRRPRTEHVEPDRGLGSSWTHDEPRTSVSQIRLAASGASMSLVSRRGQRRNR